MKKVLGVSFLALALTACGGGSSDSEYKGVDGDESTQTRLMGVYFGSTNQSQDVIGLVDKNNKYWFLYSPPYSSGVTGLMTGNLAVSKDSIKATNGKDYFFGGASVDDNSLNATVNSEKGLNGTITYTPSNQVSFDIEYDQSVNESKASLSTIAGTYYGESVLIQGMENANLTISSLGVVSGRGNSGCTFSGRITAEENAPYYNVNLVFGYSPCYLAGQEVNGIAYYDANDELLYAATETSSRTNAVLFLGSKSVPR